MAAPTVFSTQTSTTATGVSTSNITLPASVAAGDLIIAFLASDSLAGANTWPSPWVVLREGAGTGFVRSVAYLVASGGETTVAVTHTAERANHIAIRIKAAEWHGTTPPEASTASSGSSAAPDPPSITASWGAEDNLFIAACYADDGSDPGPVTAWPSGYADSQVECSHAVAGVTSAALVAIASKGTSATATDDPAAFTLTVSETVACNTLVVRPAAAGGGDTTVTVPAPASALGDAPVLVPTLSVTGLALATGSGPLPTPQLDVTAVPALAAGSAGAPSDQFTAQPRPFINLTVGA